MKIMFKENLVMMSPNSTHPDYSSRNLFPTVNHLLVNNMLPIYINSYE